MPKSVMLYLDIYSRNTVLYIYTPEFPGNLKFSTICKRVVSLRVFSVVWGEQYLCNQKKNFEKFTTNSNMKKSQYLLCKDLFSLEILL